MTIHRLRLTDRTLDIIEESLRANAEPDAQWALGIVQEAREKGTALSDDEVRDEVFDLAQRAMDVLTPEPQYADRIRERLGLGHDEPNLLYNALNWLRGEGIADLIHGRGWYLKESPA